MASSFTCKDVVTSITMMRRATFAKKQEICILEINLKAPWMQNWTNAMNKGNQLTKRTLPIYIRILHQNDYLLLLQYPVLFGFENRITQN